MPPPKASSTELFQLQNANDFNNLFEFGMGKGLGMLECVKYVECVLRGRTHLLARFTFKLLHPWGEIPLSMYNLKPRFDAFGFNSFIVSIQVLSQMWILRLQGVPSQRDQFFCEKTLSHLFLDDRCASQESQVANDPLYLGEPIPLLISKQLFLKLLHHDSKSNPMGQHSQLPGWS